MARTWRVSGEIASSTTLIITPPANELWALRTDESQGVGEINYARVRSSGIRQRVHGFYAAAGSSTGTDGIGGQSGSRTLQIRNMSVLSEQYCLTGDITSFAAEGLEEIIRDERWVDPGQVFAALPPAPGKAFYVQSVQNGPFAEGTFQIFDLSDNSVIHDTFWSSNWWDANTPPGSSWPFWLWNELNVRLRVVNTGSGSGMVRMSALRYDEAALPEAAGKLWVKTNVAAQSGFDLRPPAGEVWYVDFHNWCDTANRVIRWNGSTLPANVTGLMGRFRVSNENWARMWNATGSATKLFITGTRVVL